MFEDDHRNLQVPHRLGMRTVLVGPAAGHPHVQHQTDDLAGFLAARRLSAAAPEADVLVAGGGVAGLTAAAAFASAGFRVLCVDPVPPVTSADAEGSDLRSTAFLMPALALLDRAGLRDRLEPAAAPLRVMRIVDAGGAAGGIRDDRGLRRRGDRVRDLRLEPAELAAAPRDGGAARRAAVGRAPRRRTVERVTPRTDGAIVALSGGAQVRARAGDRGRRPRQRRPPRPRDRGAALGLRPEGAGLLRRP